MTGSYFRGDAVRILDEQDEVKFTQVTYTYYEQLNGYKYLKSLGIGYHFYQGRYFEALRKVLDLDKKTIIHIPNVNSMESTGDKLTEVERIMDVIGGTPVKDPETGIYTTRARNGKTLRIADLVTDDENRVNVLTYLRNITKREDMDIIIALGMAKEGFDWPWCEHVLTVGYRSSLTEIVQIIGRATRDCEGKEHAQFTNLIAQPEADKSAFVKLVRMLRPSRRRHRIRGRQRTLHAFSSAPAKTAAARRRYEIDSLSQAFLESISWLESAPCQNSTHRSHTKLLASTWLLQRSTLISRNPISLTALPTTSVMNSLRSRLKFEDESSQLTSYSCSKIYFRRLR